MGGGRKSLEVKSGEWRQTMSVWSHWVNLVLENEV